MSTDSVDYVIASDTDSIYLNLGPLVDCIDTSQFDAQRIVHVLNQFCEDKIVPFIDQSYDELSEYLNAYEKTLVMKRECIAERGIWTAKKRYILNVWDNEGVKYNEPKLKMMGIEAVRSSTPSLFRGYIKDALKLIMSGTESELIEFIDECRQKHKETELPLISFPRSANNITKFRNNVTLYEKGTPMHIRASILFNHLLREKNLEKKYNIINDGEKIKYFQLKMPNPAGENVIAFISEFPKEFELTQYIDYDTMFEKGFLEPLRVILKTYWMEH